VERWTAGEGKRDGMPFVDIKQRLHRAANDNGKRERPTQL